MDSTAQSACIGQRKAPQSSCNGWLSDSIIDAAQLLLKKDHPTASGLQSVSKGLTMSYDIESGEFVQILNNSRGHWLTVSRVSLDEAKCEIKVHNSMYVSVNNNVKRADCMHCLH